MKTRDIVRNYDLNGASFETWVKQSEYKYRTGLMGGIEVDDSQNVDEMVGAFKQFELQNQERAALEEAERDRAARLKQQALDSMLVTSGFGFEGYAITEYSGYISGDGVVQIDRGRDGVFGRPTNTGKSLMASLDQIRRKALTELKEAAYELGCNAVIGVDFDYLTLDPQTANSSGGTTYLPYVFGVTANGNAVTIEKNALAARP
ncbi:heavy metal-binding domain-containing protein [Sinomonas atrocyanea]|uniref:heavy metal-binding domain-containing protein n=1 Tax=Sinomonas atrocyanea TaxID=37927 RepID=UPI002855A1D0|nr:heavy metal-binding domain-containing protein [Sinomonas atrocyanea]MDR6622336.1 uncharacterized protein YbjQ (UPF0145 family) [Sinomonas atrocyanea]